MLDHHLRCWPNFEPTQGESPVFAGIVRLVLYICPVLAGCVIFFFLGTVEYGIDISVCDKEGVSALHLCAKYGHVKTAKLLLNNTSYEICDLATNSRNTALHIALQHDQWIVAEVLLSNGCSPAVQNDQGQTPLVSAIIAGHFMCAQKLLSNSDPLKYIDLVCKKYINTIN